jgi:tRNA(Ile)-lysidine synthase
VTSALHQRIRRTCRRYGLLPPGARVLVGLSGGSDSVALTLLLLDLARHAGFEVVGLAHLNHHLRPSADRDESFCRDFANRLGLPLVVEHADVRAFASENGLSIEDAARRLRYEFLARVAASVGAHQVAVGHTLDDQAETFLLKLMRGAGLTGLGGIYPRRDSAAGVSVVRPVLDLTRAELQTFLSETGERWVDDESNDDLGNPRNRVRHCVLPELDRAAGGNTRPAIARASALIRDDAQWLEQLSRERFDVVARGTPDALELDIAGIADAPLPVLRRVLLEAMRRTSGGREVGLEHVESVMALLEAGHGGVDVPGSRALVHGGTRVLVQQKGPVR